MNKMSPLIGFLFLPILVLGLIFFLTHGVNVQLLNPSGLIAMKERNLILTAVTIMFSLAIPVLIVGFFIVWKYRAENTKAKYTPEWTGHWTLKFLWWAILSTFVVIFAVIVWNGAHALDPYKPIDSSTKPITIQVVALQWKWLFIYPQEHIATVNVLELPVNTPVSFQLTADAPMSSFWIPSLGTQIYAMTAMETKLHLLSNKIGDFQGETTEINGSGYAGMKFMVRVRSQADFDSWIATVKKSKNPLTVATFNQIDKPSEDFPVTYYSSVDSNLYNMVVMKYMPKVQIKSGH